VGVKKNIGILFPVSRKMGVFQYAMSIAEALINSNEDFNYTILYFGQESPKDFLKIKNVSHVRFISLDASPNHFLSKMNFFFNCFLGYPFFTTNKKNKEILKNVNIDLLIIPFQLMFGFEHNIPYIVSIPDVMWKYYPNFPEYTLLKRIKLNFVVHYCTKYSLLNVVDASTGFSDLVTFYHVPEKKIKIIPYIPPGYIYEFKDMSKESATTLLLKYHLPEKFIFYPAQFWFHKNHLRLIETLKIIKEEKNAKINLVLVGNPGANNENYKKVMDLVKELSIEDQIFHLGYVTDKEIVALYKKSTALVFPTLIGPTSIPPLEAMTLGIPVLCSNLFSMPEEVGDAGMLFNPFNPMDMAEKIYKVWSDESLREKMVIKGYEKMNDLNLEKYAKMWIMAVKEGLDKIG